MEDHGTEASGNGEAGNQGGADLPPGMRLVRENDGTLVLGFPISCDRFLSLFMFLFGFAFIATGIFLFSNHHDVIGFVPSGIGVLSAVFGAYLAWGRLELRLGTDRLEWTRHFLQRWRTHSLERGQIASLVTDVGVYTNRRPTSWRLHFVLFEAPGDPIRKWPRRRLLPGLHAEGNILWLGGVLGKWAQAPFETALDRSESKD